jgi:TP901 family phage tail tape measure protein
MADNKKIGIELTSVDNTKPAFSSVKKSVSELEGILSNLEKATKQEIIDKKSIEDTAKAIDNLKTKMADLKTVSENAKSLFNAVKVGNEALGTSFAESTKQIDLNKKSLAENKKEQVALQQQLKEKAKILDELAKLGSKQEKAVSKSGSVEDIALLEMTKKKLIDVGKEYRQVSKELKELKTVQDQYEKELKDNIAAHESLDKVLKKSNAIVKEEEKAFKDSEKAIDKNATRLKDLEDQQKKTNKSLQENISLQKELKSAKPAAEAKAEKAKVAEAASTLGVKLESQQAAEIKKAQEALELLRKSGVATAKDLKLAEKAVDDLTRAEKGLTEASIGASKSTQSLVDSFIQIGFEFTKLAVLFTPFIAATTSAANFEFQMDKVKAITASSATEMKILSDAALDMGSKTKFSAIEAGAALEILAAAGLSAFQSQEALNSVLLLATATDTSLALAADVAAAAIYGMQIPVANLGHAMDVLVNTIQGSNVSLEELQFSFKYVAPIAAGLGISIEELSAAIGILSNAGIKGSKAGTALRGAIATLIDPTGAEAKLMQHLADRVGETSFKMRDAEGKFIGLAGVMEKLKTAGVDTAEAFELFGTEAGPAMAALLNQGTDAIMRFTKENEKADGRAQKMADTMLNNVVGSLKLLSNSFTNLKIVLGNILLPLFESFIKFLISASQSIKDFVTENEKVSKTLVYLAAIIAAAFSMGIIKNIVVLISNISGLSSALGPVINAFNKLGLAVASADAIASGASGLKILFMGLAKTAAVVGLVTIAVLSLTDALGATNTKVAETIGGFKIFGLSINQMFQGLFLGIEVGLVALKINTEKIILGMVSIFSLLVLPFLAITDALGITDKKFDALQNKLKSWHDSIAKDAKDAANRYNDLGMEIKNTQTSVEALNAAEKRATAERDIAQKKVGELTDKVRGLKDTLATLIRLEEEYVSSYAKAGKGIVDLIVGGSNIDPTILETEKKLAALASNTSITQSQRAQEILRLEKEIADRRISIVKDATDKQIGFFDMEHAVRLGMIKAAAVNEKELRDDIIKLSIETLQKKKEAYQSFADIVKTELDKALSNEEKYSQRVSDLNREITNVRQDGNELLRNISRKTMTDEGAYYDQLNEVRQKLGAGFSELSRGTIESAQRAGEFFKSAQSQAAGLTSEVKRGSEVVVTEQEAVAISYGLVQRTIEGLVSAKQKEREINQLAAGAEKLRAEQLQVTLTNVNKTISDLAAKLKEGFEVRIKIDLGPLTGIEDRLKEITKTKEMWINVKADLAEAQTELARLNKVIEQVQLQSEIKIAVDEGGSLKEVLKLNLQLSYINAELKKFEGKHTVKVVGDTKDAVNNIQDIKEALDKVEDKKTINLTAKADYKELIKLGKELDVLQGKGEQEIEISVEGIKAKYNINEIRELIIKTLEVAETEGQLNIDTVDYETKIDSTKEKTIGLKDETKKLNEEVVRLGDKAEDAGEGIYEEGEIIATVGDQAEAAAIQVDAFGRAIENLPDKKTIEIETTNKSTPSGAPTPSGATTPPAANMGDPGRNPDQPVASGGQKGAADWNTSINNNQKKPAAGGDQKKPAAGGDQKKSSPVPVVVQGISTKAVEDELKSYKDEVEKLNESLKNIGNSFKDLKKSMIDTGKTAEQIAKQSFKVLSAETNKVLKSINGLTNGSKAVSKEALAGAIESIEKQYEAIDNFLKDLIDQQKELTSKIKDAQAERVKIEEDTESKLRDARRVGLTDEQIYLDNKKLANDTYAEANKLRAKGELELAKEAFLKAQDYAIGLIQEFVNYSDKIAGIEQTTADRIKAIKSALMTDEEKWYQDRMEAEIAYQDATKALREGNFELAAKMFETSQELYTSTARTVQDTQGNVIKTLADTSAEAQRMVAETGKGAADATRRLQEEQNAVIKKGNDEALGLIKDSGDGAKQVMDSLISGLQKQQAAMQSMINATMAMITKLIAKIDALQKETSKQMEIKIDTTQATAKMAALQKLTEKYKAAAAGMHAASMENELADAQNRANGLFMGTAQAIAIGQRNQADEYAGIAANFQKQLDEAYKSSSAYQDGIVGPNNPQEGKDVPYNIEFGGKGLSPVIPLGDAFNKIEKRFEDINELIGGDNEATVKFKGDTAGTEEPLGTSLKKIQDLLVSTFSGGTSKATDGLLESMSSLGGISSNMFSKMDLPKTGLQMSSALSGGEGGAIAPSKYTQITVNMSGTKSNLLATDNNLAVFHRQLEDAALASGGYKY